MEEQRLYKMVVESLKLLSASYEEQRRYLPDFADVPDDVVSSFENSYLFLPQLIEEGRFSDYSIASLLRVYNEMQWCLRNVELDDFSSKEWNKVRELSKKALQSIGEPTERPNMECI